MEAYKTVVGTGQYAKKTGFSGKYDNVRRFWEDQITRMKLAPHLAEVVGQVRSQGRGIRVMDLGCGSADGYELLRGICTEDASLGCRDTVLLDRGCLEYYKGVDVSEELLAEARKIYGAKREVSFAKCDFTEESPFDENEDSYDLYFSSYGTFSHHTEDKTFVKLLVDIVRRTQSQSLVVCDWLGRWSYEWQNLWPEDACKNHLMDYVISYIDHGDDNCNLPALKLRLMTQHQALQLAGAAAIIAGVKIEVVDFFDRSIFTGRHMDTAEYNPRVQPLRRVVNSLFEPNIRTDLSDLIIDYVPKEGFDSANEYFAFLQSCWNGLVMYVDNLLDIYDRSAGRFRSGIPEVPHFYPPVVRRAAGIMRHLVENIGWLQVGKPRENIIEPQLGYSLRHIMTNLQAGLGHAHSLVGIFKIKLP